MEPSIEKRPPLRGLVGSLSDRVNLWIVLHTWPRPSAERREGLRAVLGQDPDADDLKNYLESLFDAWRVWLVASLVLMFIAALAGNHFAGNVGNDIGVDLGGFLAGFCIVGELDAAWRVNRARRASYIAPIESERSIVHAARLVHQARTNDAVILLQLIGGLIWLLLAIEFL